MLEAKHSLGHLDALHGRELLPTDFPTGYDESLVHDELKAYCTDNVDTGQPTGPIKELISDEDWMSTLTVASHYEAAQERLKYQQIRLTDLEAIETAVRFSEHINKSMMLDRDHHNTRVYHLALKTAVERQNLIADAHKLSALA